MMARDESAVSAVVGAVLLLALFSTAMTVYTVTTLPEWKADKEHNHQLAVEQAFAGLKADVEALAARRDPGPVAAAIPLEVPKVALIQPAAARGTLAYEDGFAVTFAFPTTPELFASDGASVAAPTASIATPPCTAKCIVTLDDLVLAMATTGVDGAGESVLITATVTDSAATPATVTGVLAHTYTGGTAGSCTGELRFTVGSAVHVVQPCVGAALASATAPYRLNLLDDDYTFASAVARLTTPLQLTFTSSVTGTGPALAASGYAANLEDDAGLLRVAGTGTSTTTPLPNIDGGRLVYSPQYQSFPSQDLLYEGGAVFVDAGPTQQAVASEPNLAIDVADGWGSLSWTLVELTGTGSVSGGKQGTATVTYQTSHDVLLRVPASAGSCTGTGNACATITLTTDTAQGWLNHASVAKLAAGAGDSVTLATGTGTLTLSVHSSATLPVTNGWVLRLRVIQAEVEVT